MSNMPLVVDAGEVIMINFGLHYRDWAEYERHSKAVLNSFLHYAHYKVIIWRGSSTQHFNAHGGEWPAGR